MSILKKNKDALTKDSGSFTNQKKEIEAYWNKTTSISDFEDSIKEGFDIELNRNNKNSNIVKAVMRLQGPLLKLINDMLEIDPTKRINITTVYRRYVTLVRNFNPNKKKRV